jgi:hypothetical protein
MISKTLLFMTTMAPAALADFKVYCGTRCVVADAGGCAPACHFMNNEPSCADIQNSVNFHITDDTSGCGGVACDGCDDVNPAAEWEITRLEINNDQGCNPSVLYWEGGGDNPHFSKSNHAYLLRAKLNSSF